MELGLLDYRFLVPELQSLVGARVQKIYVDDGVHAFHLYAGGQRTLVLTDGVAFLTDAKLAHAKTPGGYCTFLRRRLDNARLVRVAQHNHDRILALAFETREDRYVLYAELFREINTILTRDDTIVSALHTASYADRTIRGGIAYVPPPNGPPPEDLLTDALAGKPAAKTLAVELGLGGKWAEELCSRAGVHRGDALTPAQVATLRDALAALVAHPLDPVYTDDEALPFPFKTKPESASWTRASSFAAAIGAVAVRALEHGAREEATAETRERVTKQEKILKAQRAQREKLTTLAAQEQRAGELLYERYDEVQTVLATIRDERKRLTLAELRERYAKHPLVKSINDDGTIDVELGD